MGGHVRGEFCGGGVIGEDGGGEAVGGVDVAVLPLLGVEVADVAKLWVVIWALEVIFDNERGIVFLGAEGREEGVVDGTVESGGGEGIAPPYRRTGREPDGEPSGTAAGLGVKTTERERGEVGPSQCDGIGDGEIIGTFLSIGGCLFGRR